MQGERALARPGGAAHLLAGRGARPRRGSSRRLAGPRRPQDRVPLSDAKRAFLEELPSFGVDYGNATTRRFRRPSRRAIRLHPERRDTRRRTGRRRSPDAPHRARGADGRRGHVGGRDVPARPRSRRHRSHHVCTNTSNPAVMVGAGLLAKKAVERGLQRKPWVKSSLAPGSKVVTEYYEKAGLTPYLDELGFYRSATGARPASGTPGRSPAEIPGALRQETSWSCAVLSGNRNFEARIHPEVKANYLASPPLVIAYALAGRMDIDLVTEPSGSAPTGRTSSSPTSGPPRKRYSDTAQAHRREMFRPSTRSVRRRRALAAGCPCPRVSCSPGTQTRRTSGCLRTSRGCRSSPRGSGTFPARAASSPSGIGDHRPHLAGRRDQAGFTDRPLLVDHGVERKDFNSYGSRRGNHEVMVRGTFANVRLRNQLVPGSEGTLTVHCRAARR